METENLDEVPASEGPFQVTDQVSLEHESTRVLEPEIQEDRKPEQKPAVAQFDLAKLSYELQQGYRIYVELLADSNRNLTWPFLEPVDAESLGLWDYYERIKEPMCFATIGSKFTEYKYNSITEVVADMRLILENCYRYNGPDHWVSKLGQKLEKILEQKLALLNKSLRDKVTLLATMSLNQDLPLVAELEASGRRRSSRQNYLNMVNGENSSSLVNHVKIQEESVEKERRKQREKEKKEANQALLQDLVEWEKKELTPEIMDQLHSMWEIPSVGSFLYLVRDILCLEDINLTEFELSFIYPNKSSLLAKIFTALLITPHQRKSLYKRPVMKFKRWESKLKEKLDVWYKLAEKECFYVVSVQYGIDLKFFDILGQERNPLEEKSYLDLTLYQRVWLLKTLCDVCFHKDYDIRDKVNSCDFMEQRELFLGNDAESRSYIYFPVFQTTDVRIYQHDELEVPKLEAKVRKLPSPPATPSPERKKTKKLPSKPSISTRPARSLRLRQLRGDPVLEDKTEQEGASEVSSDEANGTEAKSDPPPVFEVTDGFKLACHDIETLKTLAEQFAEPPVPPKKRGRKPKVPPPRKRCEVELHETLLALLQELEKYEGAFSRNYTKARIKIMKESLEPEAIEEPEEEVPEAETVEEWSSDLSDDDDGAKLDAKDEDFRIEDEYGSSFALESKRAKLDSELQSVSDDSENGSVKAIQTNSPRQKRKRKPTEDNTDTANSVSCTIAIQTPNPKMKKKAKKWSPTKECLSINPKSALSPSVVISAVSAEESVRATAISQKGVSIVKSPSNQPKDELQTTLSPKIILVNSLTEALKRAKMSSITNAAKSTAVDSSQADDKDTSPQETVAASVVTSKASPPTSAASSLQAQNSRKRVLVSPEGKTHEVKLCVTMVCSSTTTPVITPSIHPPIQRRTAVKIVSSVKGDVPTGSVRATPIALPRTVVTTPQNKLAQSTGNAPSKAPAGNHPRPNILSRSLKQGSGQSGVAVQTSAVSHNHSYAISQGNATGPQQQNPSGLGMENMKAAPLTTTTTTTSTVKMVQIIPSSKQTDIAKVNSLYGLSSPVAKPSTGVNTLGKTVSGQSGVKVASPRASQGVPTSNVSHIKTMPVKNSQVSLSQTPQAPSKSTVIKSAASVAAKAQPLKQTPRQTKVVFIPATSVDAKSPLASFKPQTLTTTNGQSIYGYAVVVPPGSPEEVNAVISSALRKPTSVAVKQPNTPSQPKQNQTIAVSQAVVARKAPTASLSNVSQPRPGVATSSTPSASVPVSGTRPLLLTSSTTQPRPGVATSSTPSATVPVSVARTLLMASNTTQPRPGVATSSTPSATVPVSVARTLLMVSNTTQPRPGIATSSSPSATVPVSVARTLSMGSSSTQPRPGVATSSTSSATVPVSVARTLLLASNTTQPRPGVASSSTPTSATVPVSVARTLLMGSSSTQPRPGVTASSMPCPKATKTSSTSNVNGSASVQGTSLGSSTTQPRPGVTTSTTTVNVTVPLSVVLSVLSETNTKQPRPSVMTSPSQPRPGVEISTTNPRLVAATNPQTPVCSNVATTVNSVVSQPCPVTSSPKRPVSTIIVSKPVSTTTAQSRLDQATMSQRPIVTNVQMPAMDNVLGSGTAHPRFDSTINVHTTTIYPGVQNLPVAQPSALETCSQVTESTSTSRQTESNSVNAIKNGKKSHDSDHKDSSMTGSVGINNGPCCEPNSPKTNVSSVVPRINEAVSVPAGQPPDSGSQDLHTEDDIKQTSSQVSVTPLPAASEKQSHLDKLSAKTDDQRTVTYCNGVSVHPTLKSLDSIRNMKHAQNDTADTSSANGVPEGSNNSTPHCPAVTNN